MRHLSSIRATQMIAINNSNKLFHERSFFDRINHLFIIIIIYHDDGPSFMINQISFWLTNSVHCAYYSAPPVSCIVFHRALKYNNNCYVIQRHSSTNEFEPNDILLWNGFLEYLSTMSLRKVCDSAPGILLEGHVWIKFASENFPNQK